MNITNVCRVCLSSYNKMHIVTSMELQEIYEKLAGTKLITPNMTNMLCFICLSLLRRCAKFARTARTSDCLLTDLVSRGSYRETLQPVMYNYSTTPIEYVTLMDAINDDSIKHKISEIVDQDSEEKLQIKSEPEVDNCIDTYSSDSEDDVPLNTLRTESKPVKQKRKYVKTIKLDAHKIYLTKEQQLQAMQARAQSLNYINSPYKCEMCFKGFVSEVAYGNHKEKHNERSGPFECNICRLRYSTSRMHRSHVTHAHYTLYKCNRCTHLSHTAHQAQDHERWHNGHTYECQLCGQKFKKRTSYLTHKRLRHATDHICHICGDKFVSRHGLLMHHNKSHWREVEEDNTEPSHRYCSECDIQFATLIAWKKHLLNSIKHTLKSEDSKQCPICTKQIQEGSSLEDHLKEHEKKLRKKPIKVNKDCIRVPIPCEECTSTFSNRSKLQAHFKRIHLGLRYNKNIICEVCGKKWTSNAALKYHQRVHTGEKPYACPNCPKRFVDSNQLKIHARTHTGERPYACSRCERTFTQKPALNRHFRVHTGVKPYVCQLCSKSFSQSNSLKVHVRSVHEKIPYRRQKIVDEKPMHQ